MRRGAAWLLLLLALAACSGEADFSDSMPAPVVLSAEKYQSEILLLDRLVFTPGPVDDARRKTMGDEFEKLGLKIKEGSDSKFLLLESLELRALAGHARRAEEGRAMTGLQQNWMRIRSNVFDDRAWFARSAADLAPAAEMTQTTASVAPEVTKATPEPAHSEGAIVLHTNPLEGRWRVRELYGNGKRMHDAELSPSVWTLDEGLLSMESGGASSHYSYSEVHDERGAALHVRESDSPSNRPPADGWMIYALEGNQLQVAFFDGLGERPDGFVRKDGKTEPMLTLAILDRVP
jgi:uncharacterized protein (TIGR03067 family)